MAEKRDNMLKSNAEILEKSYAILTPKQKEQLKVLTNFQKYLSYCNHRHRQITLCYLTLHW